VKSDGKLDRITLWNHYAISKYWRPTTHWHRVIYERTGNLIC